MAELRPLVLSTLFLAVLGWLGLRLLPGLLADDDLTWDAAGFTQTPCIRVATTAIEHASRYHTSYRPALVCDYTVDGRSYRIDSRDAWLGFSLEQSEVAARERAHQYANEHPPQAYYDPRDPSRAVMSRAVEPDRTSWLFVIGGALSALCALISLAAITARGARAYRRARRERDDFPSARARERHDFIER